MCLKQVLVKHIYVRFIWCVFNSLIDIPMGFFSIYIYCDSVKKRLV